MARWNGCAPTTGRATSASCKTSCAGPSAFARAAGPPVAPRFPEGDAGARSLPGTEAGRDEAVAGLRKAIVWPGTITSKKLWPLLRDLLERELLTFALARLAAIRPRWPSDSTWPAHGHQAHSGAWPEVGPAASRGV